MAFKRDREADTAIASPKNKRPKIDTDLAHIWEKLSDDNADARLAAAHKLISKHCQASDLENAQHIAKRLFRGLCSSRKHARPGFYVAAVGALSIKPDPLGCKAITRSEIVSILQTQTIPESGTSGQDERDHYFGRLLGVKAIIDSELLATQGEFHTAEWEQILDVMYSLMEQKPWLRSEGSSIICSVIDKISLLEGVDVEQPMIQTVRHLKKHKLVRTIDGLAIWLTVQEHLLSAQLPQDLWTKGDPLHSANTETLKKVLLSIQAHDELDEDASGNTVWSTKLHHAWILILKRTDRFRKNGQLTLTDLWQSIVDNGMFNHSSTPERKVTGFLVFDMALRTLPNQSVHVCFSANVMACIVHSLRAGNDNYLHEMVTKLIADMQSYCRENQSDRTNEIIKGLLIGSGLADLDILTKTRIIQPLFQFAEISCKSGICKDMLSWLQQLPSEEQDLTKLSTKRKNLLNILQRAVHQSVRSGDQTISKDTGVTSSRFEALSQIVEELLKLKEKAQKTNALDVPYDESTYDVLREKINSMLDTLLLGGPAGRQAFFKVLRTLHEFELEADEGITDSIALSWQLIDRSLEKLTKRVRLLESGDVHPGHHQIYPEEGSAILLALNLLQVFDGDEESIEILEEVSSMVSDLLDGKSESEIADHIIEIILSLLSKPSKFLRRAGGLTFEAFARFMSFEGLKALCEILATNEGRTGQQELFENDEVDLDDDSDSRSASESGSTDSDVEVIDNSENLETLGKNNTFLEDSDSESASDSDESSKSSDEQASEVDDAGSNDLESALAAALGTRKLKAEDLNNDLEDTDSDSDSDMSDSQMIELDEKLAEVFRSKQTEASAQKMRKEEMKNAKENVVNLKNRALDLVEIFLRSQQSKGMECVELLSSLLELAKTTGTPQLAHRALELIKNYAQKAKGAKLPAVKQDTETRKELVVSLEGLHSLVTAKDVSNAVIEAASQLNILLCKLLLQAGEENVKDTIKRIASEQELSPGVQRKALQEFWQRYDAWASTLQMQNGEKPRQGIANGNDSRSSKKSLSTKPKDRKKVKKFETR